MKSLKYKLLARCLIFFIAITFSCKKKTENIIPQTDSNNISFIETTPNLGAVPFVAPLRSSNPVLMAKRDAKIYVFLKTTAGGDFSVSGFSYDVNANSFNTVKSLATGLFISSNGYNSTLTAVSNGLWYASPNVSLLYGIGTDSWTSYNPSASAGANNGVCTMLDKVYYAGNIYSGNGGLLAAVGFNVYDYSKGIWATLANLPYLAENPAMQPYNNQFIYAIGGEQLASGSTTKKFAMYNSQNNTWASLPNLPFDYYAPINGHTTTILKNKYLLVYSYGNKIYLYNLETKLWNNNPILNLGEFEDLTNINIFSNSNAATDDGDAFYIAGTTISGGVFKIKKYTIK